MPLFTPNNLGVAAALTHLFAYWLYYKATRRGEIQPNVSAWLMALIINVAQTALYADLTKLDITDNLLQVVCTIFSIIIFFLALHKGRSFGNVSWIDVTALLINCGAITTWLYYRSPEWGSVIMGVADVASFIPILWTTWLDPRRERSVPWVWWTVAYGLLTTSTILEQDYWESIFPGMNLILHLMIALLALRVTRRVKKV